MPRPPTDDIPRGILRARLEARREEIEEAAISHVYAVSTPPPEADPAYVAGIRAAISAGMQYAFAALDGQREEAPSPPVVLLTQARLAARAGIALEDMLRRYIAGYTFFGSILFEEVEKAEVALAGDALKRLTHLYTTDFDRLLAAVTEEYRREADQQLLAAERGPARLVRRLLSGDLIDPSPLAYGLENSHIGVVASGGGASEVVRDFATRLDCLLLLVEPDEHTVWAWLGTRRRDRGEDMEHLAASRLPANLGLALGEPAEGPSGWRLTHRQAAAALPIAQRRPGEPTRYGDVTLLAAAFQEDLLAASLRRLYLEPLRRGRRGGAIDKETLRAYFSAGRNVSSAAALLGVNRRTVSARLAAIEARYARKLDDASAEIETALRLDELEVDPPTG